MATNSLFSKFIILQFVLENKPTLQVPIIKILFTNGLEDVIQVLYPSSKNSDQILVHPISKINSSFFGVNVTFCLHDYIPKKILLYEMMM